MNVYTYCIRYTNFNIYYFKKSLKIILKWIHFSHLEAKILSSWLQIPLTSTLSLK